MKEKVGRNLKLIVTKGPSSGYESDFLPRVKINIGWVVRGNKVSIKDAGISSKHLILQFDSGSGNWTVTDLDSSNGTSVNSKSLIPSIPYPLSDNDFIKFGENTEIKVKIAVSDEEFRPLRVTRRQAVVGGGKLGAIEEDSEIGLVFSGELGENEKKRGGGRRGRVQKNENSETGKESERLENLGENEVKDVGIVSVGLKRVTRSSRRKGNDEEIGDAGMGRETRGLRMTRSTRNEEMLGNKVYDSARWTENVGAVQKEMEKGWGKSQKRTRSTSIEKYGFGENVVEGGLVVDSEVIDGRSKRNCTRVRKKKEVEVEKSFENGQIREEEMREKHNLREGGGYAEVEKNQVDDRVEFMRDNDCGDGFPGVELKASESLENGQIREEEMGEKSNLQEEGDCGELEKNGDGDRVESMKEKVCGDGLASSPRINHSVLGRLETMTLGQWLDYIEDYLPKQIVEETDEMIMEMRRKAERFHEFILQQKAAEGGGVI